MSSASVPELSIVVPLFNEEESLPLLVEKLLLALRPLGRSFELVLVDDGSSDRTADVLRQQAAGAPELVAVLLRRNYGQTAAMAASFDASRGRLIVTLDGDLQNDPADIPMLLGASRRATTWSAAGVTSVRTMPSAACSPARLPTP